MADASDKTATNVGSSYRGGKGSCGEGISEGSSNEARQTQAMKQRQSPAVVIEAEKDQVARVYLKGPVTKQLLPGGTIAEIL
jgi:hypothetical protein